MSTSTVQFISRRLSQLATTRGPLFGILDLRVNLFHMIGPLRPSVDFYIRNVPVLNTLVRFSVIACPRFARHFTLCVDGFLLTDNDIGDSPNGIHSVSRLLLTQIAVISSPRHD
jgi:hypothetical protein